MWVGNLAHSTIKLSKSSSLRTAHEVQWGMLRLRTWFSRATPTSLIILSLVVGVGGAIGATLFHLLIATFTALSFGSSGELGFVEHVAMMPSWQRVLIPTLGGLLVGIVFTIVKVTEAEGEGVPEVMEALALRRGKIRPWVAPVKILTAALTLGTGGSSGREGPIIQIGSAIGSSVGQFVRLDQEHTRLLLAAGAAAGIGGTFGAPVAGVVFSVELLLKRVTFFKTIIISVSALTGSGITKLVIGHEGLRFDAGEAAYSSVTLLAAAFLLGILAAGVAVLFGIILRSCLRIFKYATLPRIMRSTVGGFLIGLIGLALPYIHEPAAYPLMIDLLSLSTLPAGFLILLLIVKMLATGITLGSGGSGGIFAPALLIGTLLGSVFGNFLTELGVISASDTATMALVGMGAVFAGTAHAPFTAIFILYEMTDEVMALPLIIIACLTATYCAKKLHTESVYTEQNPATT